MKCHCLIKYILCLSITTSMQKHSHMLMDKFILLYLFDEEGLIRKLKQTKKTNKPQKLYLKMLYWFKIVQFLRKAEI